MAGILYMEGSDRYAAERARMVREQIEARGVRNPDVLRVMRTTPRHLFVPESLHSQAYGDGPLPIGKGQTISQPFIVASMTEILSPGKGHRVLEIGTGSGYQAAVLSQLCREVFTIEIVPELGTSATALLGKLGYSNVTVRIGDGYKGWPEKAPFDRIILTAAPVEIPQTLIDQLARGGKMVAPVGSSGQDQELVVIEKQTDGKITRRLLYGVRFVPMVKAK
jgi:protein-L-isoaspartate(D-aspartate) O-methyltransferase